MKTKSSSIKLAARSLFKTMILGGILFSTGIGVGQELPKATLEQLAKIPASKFTKVIRGSTSPDKRFSVVLGSQDWSKSNWDDALVRERNEFLLERNYAAEFVHSLGAIESTDAGDLPKEVPGKLEVS